MRWVRLACVMMATVLTGAAPLLGQTEPPPASGGEAKAAELRLENVAGRLRQTMTFATLAVLSPTLSDHRLHAQRIVNWLEGSGGRHFVPRVSPEGEIRGLIEEAQALVPWLAGRALDQPTREQALFFARNVRHFFNQAYITCLLAKGADKVHVLDRKDFDGGIVADIEDAMRFIERNTRTAWRIKGLRRQDIPEYPMNALREAITNAVMHRDWFMEGANVFVEIYTDRIEVSSPGGLPKGMKLSDLGHKSVRRNALIADLLHRIDFIEKAGTGIKRIRDEARVQGCPEPLFEETGFVTATFFPNPEVRAQAGGQPAGAPELVGTKSALSQAHDGVHETEDSTASVPQVPRKHPASTPQVLAILKAAASGEKTREELQIAAEIKDREHFRKEYLEALLSAELLERTIPDKPRSPKQRYRTTAGGRSVLENSDKESQS